MTQHDPLSLMLLNAASIHSSNAGDKGAQVPVQDFRVQVFVNRISENEKC